jgi:hypothetical protein
MVTRSAALLGLLASFTVSVPLWAKGDMVLIEISGASLKSPVQITDRKIEEFSIWAGPPFSTGDGISTQTEGFIIDWPAGALSGRPSDLEHYEVRFYVGCKAGANRDCGDQKPHLAYVVSYDYDPASKRGFVYLPGKGDPFYYVNIGSIAHGPEGHWFFATASWEGFARPLIANAQRD